MTTSRRQSSGTTASPIAAPADQDSGLHSSVRPSRAEMRAAEREKRLQHRVLRHRSVIVVWVVAAIFFGYLFWEGAGIFGTAPALLSGLNAGARAEAAAVGMALPLVGYGLSLWGSFRLSWWRALVVFAAGWGASVAVWITAVYLFSAVA